MAASNYSPGGPADVALRLRTAVTRIDRLLSREVLGGTLTRTQFSVLGVLARQGEQRLADLVDREGLNPSMLSRIVGVLEREGWADRLPAPGDGRAVLVRITPAGTELHQRLQRDRSALITGWLDGLDDEAGQRLAAALPLLEDLAEDLARRRAAAGAGAGARR